MKVWLLSFESIYVKKVGGLAEVPPRLAKALREKGVDAYVFTPSHGIKCGGDSRPLFSTEFNGANYSVELCNYEVPHLIARGGALEDPVVYPRDLSIKALAFGMVVKRFYEHLSKKGEAPHILHGNDWHSGPALIGALYSSSKTGTRLGTVYHIHLLSRASISLELYQYFLEIDPHALFSGTRGARPFIEYFEISGGVVDKLVSLLVDKVITVSRGFSKDVKRALGFEASGKVDYIYNAVTWSWQEVKEAVKKTYGLDPEDIASRRIVRKRILTRDLNRINVVVPDPALEKSVKLLEGKYDIGGKRSFDADGPLVLLSGRVSHQKGFDYLIKAMDYLVANLPNIRIIIAAIPLEGTLDLLEKLFEAQLLYKENLRVLAGFVDPDYYKLLFYASNAYLAPSRYEPFGLVAVEALASGTPVAASRTGGLSDIVEQIGPSGEGTGVLFEVGDYKSMSRALVELVDLMEAPYAGDKGGADAAVRIRRRCIESSTRFTWANSADKAIRIYSSITGAS